MGLREADIRPTYFLNGISPYFFYNELYLHSSEITIALGYFARTAFCIGTESLLVFIKNGGKIHLVCNDKILPEDAKAISLGYESRVNSSVSLKDFESLISSKKDQNDLNIFSYKCLAYLIAIGNLDIKIAKSDRLVHFKAGYAKDTEGNTVAFSGSVNLTLSALLFNWEQLTTYCSWINPEVFGPRIKEIVDPVNQLMNGEIEELPLINGSDIEKYILENYKVQDFSELEHDAKLARRRIKIKVGNEKAIKIVDDTDPPFLSIQASLIPRPHQIDALSNFFQNKCQTLFAMATGTGKTLTALFAANDLCFDVDIQSILILVPLTDLVNQWAKDVRNSMGGGDSNKNRF